MDRNTGEAALLEEPEAPPSSGLTGKLVKASFFTGSIAMLAAMFADFLAVVCRHVGIPFIGAIEIIQACVVLAISASIVAVTLTNGHAAVHLITERLSPRWKQRMLRVASALGFVSFGILALGEAWLLYDTYLWDERSDLLGLPILPLRVIWTASLAVAALLLLLRLASKTPHEEPTL